jgi:HlyD family secretion protein
VDRRFLNPICFLAAVLLTSCQPGNSKYSVSGTIQVDEVRVGSRYGGRVQNITAWEGDSLEPGQLFITLDAAELRAQHDHAAAVLAELAAGPRKEEVATAEATWEALTAELEFAQANAKRAEELFRQKTISATERDQTVTQAQALTKNVAAAKSRYDLLFAGTRPEQIEQARAQLEQTKTQLSEMEIRAPTNAVLEVLSVRVGDMLAPNQPAATLILPQHIWVRVFVPQPWLGHIKVGASAEVRVDAFPDRVFNGVVEQISREAEFTPRNVQTVAERIKQVFGVKVRLNPEDELRAGMSADVTFPNVPK